MQPHCVVSEDWEKWNSMAVITGKRASSYVSNASNCEGIAGPELFHINARQEKILRNRLVQPLYRGRSAGLVSSIISLPSTILN